jgi:hypothetical protein
MALGLLKATAGTGSGFFLDNFFFPFTWILGWLSACFCAYKLIADGFGLAHSHCRYRQWFFSCKIKYSLESFELTIS